VKPRHRAAALAAVLIAQGCASDATFLKPDGSVPDQHQLEQDASACRDLGPLAAGFFGGALLGAAQGAIIGAGGGNAGPAALVGAAAGGVIGLLVGAATSASGEGYERCMAEKGYHRS
jgi:mannitol-specific phosphotransferase system IIBC component